MNPCEFCDRTFEKRAGLMRHIGATHPDRVVAVNPGGAIAPVVPPEPETYAEGLTPEQLAPGQEPYVDPPAEQIMSDWADDVLPVLAPGDRAVVVTVLPETINQDSWHERYANVPDDLHMQIRDLQRRGLSEAHAFEEVTGRPMPQPPTSGDDRPLLLQQIAFRVRNTEIDQIDARYLLRLAEIGQRAVELLDKWEADGDFDTSFNFLAEAQNVVNLWKEATS